MQPVKNKLVLEVHPAYQPTVSKAHYKSSVGIYTSPSSPKISELRTRYEALHTAEGDFRSLNPASFLKIVK